MKTRIFLSVILSVAILVTTLVSVSATSVIDDDIDISDFPRSANSVNGDITKGFGFPANVNVFTGYDSALTYDISDGFKMSFSDIAWTDGDDAIMISIGNGERAVITSYPIAHFVIAKNGDVVAWGETNDQNNTRYGANTTFYEQNIINVLSEGFTSFTFSMIPDSTGLAKLYINGTLVTTISTGWINGIAPLQTANLAKARIGFYRVLRGDVGAAGVANTQGATTSDKSFMYKLSSFVTGRSTLTFADGRESQKYFAGDVVTVNNTLTDGEVVSVTPAPANLATSDEGVTTFTMGTNDVTLSVDYSKTDSNDIYAVYSDQSGTAPRTVNITWGSNELSFTYSSGNRVWNADSLNYVGDEAGWIKNENAWIKIENRSDVAVKVDFEYTSNGSAASEGIDLNFLDSQNQSVTSYVLVKAPVDPEDNMGTLYQVSLKPTGVLSSTVTSSTKIGTVSVTITDAAEATS